MTSLTAAPEKAASSASSTGYIPFDQEPREHTVSGGLLLGAETVCGRMQERLTHLDLFSGIGGFALAARWAGMNTIGFSEIDPYATAILKRHWPDVPNYGDIRNVRGVRADILTGGFPCQPFSQAGQRRGTEDDRHLWPEMFRVIEDAQPRWIIGENVPGIISMELDSVLADLEGGGYSAWPLAIPAVGVDARHRRERIWIVAHADSAGPQGRIGEELRKCAAEWFAWQGGSPLADANGSRSHAGPQAGIHRREAGGGARDVEPQRFCEWETEPDVGRVADGIPKRVDRLRGLGNAIVPQVAFALLDHIAALEFTAAVADAGRLVLPGQREREKQSLSGAQECNGQSSATRGEAGEQP